MSRLTVYTALAVLLAIAPAPLAVAARTSAPGSDSRTASAAERFARQYVAAYSAVD
jgi:hypothetical protein